MKSFIKMTFLLITGILAQVANADDIYLKNGAILKNCLVKDTTENKIKFNTSTGYRFINLLIVVKIEYLPFDSTKDTEMIYPTFRPSESNLEPLKIENISTTKYKYPNIHFLSVTALGLVVTWDGFARVSNLQNSIDANNKFAKLLHIEIDNSSLQSEKTRATVMGIVGIGVTLFSTFYSLERVEIKSDGKSLSLAYSF